MLKGLAAVNAHEHLARDALENRLNDLVKTLTPAATKLNGAIVVGIAPDATSNEKQIHEHWPEKST